MPKVEDRGGSEGKCALGEARSTCALSLYVKNSYRLQAARVHPAAGVHALGRDPWARPRRDQGLPAAVDLPQRGPALDAAHRLVLYCAGSMQGGLKAMNHRLIDRDQRPLVTVSGMLLLFTLTLFLMLRG